MAPMAPLKAPLVLCVLPAFFIRHPTVLCVGWMDISVEINIRIHRHYGIESIPDPLSGYPTYKPFLFDFSHRMSFLSFPLTIAGFINKPLTEAVTKAGHSNLPYYSLISLSEIF